MSGEAFLDTNFLLYHLDDSDARKHRIVHRLIRRALERGDVCISFQVVQEFLNAALRKARVPIGHAEARDYFHLVLAPLWKIMPSSELYLRGLGGQERYGFGFRDSLIVAAAVGAGCARLYRNICNTASALTDLLSKILCRFINCRERRPVSMNPACER